MLAAFGFTHAPFTKEIPPTALFPSQALQELAARLQVMVDTRALGVVTGEIGSGKSSAVRPRAARLDPVQHPVVYLAESALTPTDFYAGVLEAFGVTPQWRRSLVRRQFRDLMPDLYTHQHKVPVLICDEAQQLPFTTLQELRYIANLEMDALTPFACILVGQPDLRATLRQRVFEAVQQRITLRFHLTGLTRAELDPYLAHHVRLAGVDRPLFSPAATELLFQHSQGLPRLVNRLATAALWDAAGRQAALVDGDHVERAVGEWREA
jgi:type II secretory pathway predicted ATPase ExeA